MALPASDSFSAGTTQSITAYSGNWSVLEGAINVNANGRYFGAAAGYNTARWNADAFGADQYSQVTLDNSATGSVYNGPAVRCQSAANTSYHCEGSGTSVYLSKCVAGTQSTLAGPITVSALAAGDVLRLEVRTVGGNAELKIFRALAASPTSFIQVGSTYTDSSSPITTAGYAGIFAYDSNNDIGSTAWAGGNLASAPTAPSNVTVGSLTTTGATVQWQDNSGDETGFDVEIAAGPTFNSWSTVSGSPTSANATSIAVTGLSNGASYQARVRAKNGAGDSAYVTSSTFTTQTPVKVRPISDITIGSWTPSTGSTLYGVLDEASADDADYASIIGNGTMEVRLGTALDPGVNYGHTPRYRLQGDGAKSFTVRLVQGSTIISTDPVVRTPPNGVWTTYSWTLTASEVDAITDYSDLRIRVTVS